MFNAKATAELGSFLRVTQGWFTVRKPEETVLSKVSEDKKLRRG